MIQDWTKFLSDLKVNNNTNWFHAHKHEYQKVKTEFETLIADLIPQMVKIDPTLGILSVKDCTFRINRDIRFTKDKSPYKTWLAASFSVGSKTGSSPTYYFHIDSSGEVTIAGGLYAPSSEQLLVFRKKVSDDPKELLKILENKELKNIFGSLSGEKLVKIPRGFKADDQNAEILKHKSVTLFSLFNLNSAGQDDFRLELLRRFKALKLLVEYLRKIGC